MAGNNRNFTKVMEISNQLDLDNCESITGWTAWTDTTSIAISTTHKTWQNSLSFAKSWTTWTTWTVYKSIWWADWKHWNIFWIHKIKLMCYLSSITNVASVSLLIWTDSSNYNTYTETSLTSGWNDLSFDCDSETSQTGTWCNWYQIKYVAVVVTFNASANTLTWILIDTIYLYKANFSWASSSSNNIEQVWGVNVPTDDSAMPATPKMLAVWWEYRASPTTYTDWDATVLQTDVNWKLKVAMSGDIEIWAVELKNWATDDRALISDADTARTTTDHVLSTQNIWADWTVAPTWSLNTNAPFTKLTDWTSDLTLWTWTVKTVPSEIHDWTTWAVIETDGTKKALNVNITDGTNDMPTMDAVWRAWYISITDWTETASVNTSNELEVSVWQLTATTPFFDSDWNNTAQVLKAGSWQLRQIIIENQNASNSYVQLFDTAAWSVTVWVTNPVFVIPIPPASNAVIDFNWAWMDFSTAITYACTTTSTWAWDPTTWLMVSANYI